MAVLGFFVFIASVAGNYITGYIYSLQSTMKKILLLTGTMFTLIFLSGCSLFSKKEHIIVEKDPKVIEETIDDNIIDISLLEKDADGYVGLSFTDGTYKEGKKYSLMFNSSEQDQREDRMFIVPRGVQKDGNEITIFVDFNNLLDGSYVWLTQGNPQTYAVTDYNAFRNDFVVSKTPKTIKNPGVISLGYTTQGNIDTIYELADGKMYHIRDIACDNGEVDCMGLYHIPKNGKDGIQIGELTSMKRSGGYGQQTVEISEQGVLTATHLAVNESENGFAVTEYFGLYNILAQKNIVSIIDKNQSMTVVSDSKVYEFGGLFDENGFLVDITVNGQRTSTIENPLPPLENCDFSCDLYYFSLSDDNSSVEVEIGDIGESVTHTFEIAGLGKYE